MASDPMAMELEMARDLKSSLLEAVLSGDNVAVCSLLERGISVSASSLIAASLMGHYETVRILLDHGAQVNGEGMIPTIYDVESNLPDDFGPSVGTEVLKRSTSALIIASFHGHVKITELLLKYGALVNMVDKGGISALLEASFTGHIEIVQLLLTDGAQVNVQDNEGRFALMLSSFAGHTEIVKLLLAHGAEVNMVNNAGTTALIEACITRHIEVATLLLDSGAVADLQNSEGTSALMAASFAGCTDIVQLLIGRHVTIDLLDAKGRSALMIASLTGSSVVVKLMLEKYEAQLQLLIATDKNKRATLIRLCVDGHLDTVKLLLDHGAQVNLKNKMTGDVLSAACFMGRAETVQLLLEYGAQIEASALWIASFTGGVKKVKCLLDHGAAVNAQYINGSCPLIAASLTGHTEIVRLLLDYHAEVDMQDDEGRSSLMGACFTGSAEIVDIMFQSSNPSFRAMNDVLSKSSLEGHIEIVQLLLDRGAQVNLHSDRSLSPLVSACLTGHIETVKLLIHQKADVNAQSKEELTALMVATAGGHVETMKLLLDHNAEVNLATGQGISALMMAVLTGNSEMVKLLFRLRLTKDLVNLSVKGHTEALKLLLDRGAEVNMKTRDGTSALQMASFIGHAETVKLLLDYGANVNMVDNDGDSALIVASALGGTFAKRLLSPYRIVQSEDSLKGVNEEGYIETIKLLLLHGADVNTRDVYKHSALLVASLTGNVEILKLLIKSGSRIDLTAIECARQRGDVEVVEFLYHGLNNSSSSPEANTAPGASIVQILKELALKFEQLSSMQNSVVSNQAMILEEVKAMNVTASSVRTQSADVNSPQQHLPTANEDLVLSLRNVLRELRLLASDWHEIGIFLRLPPGQLNIIQADNDRVTDCLRKMLEEWLNMVAPPPSWEQLVEAVAVVNQSKAKEIHDKYCC